VEVTTLVVPGLNDDETMMRQEAGWLSGLSKEIVLHLTRFFPMYRMLDCAPTPIVLIDRLAGIAREFLPHVYKGIADDPEPDRTALDFFTKNESGGFDPPEGERYVKNGWTADRTRRRTCARRRGRDHVS
jgi:hypothetical protein